MSLPNRRYRPGLGRVGCIIRLSLTRPEIDEASFSAEQAPTIISGGAVDQPGSATQVLFACDHRRVTADAGHPD